ncbi:unnamed protein product, partial [Amoebophrya sp. A120]
VLLLLFLLGLSQDTATSTTDPRNVSGFRALPRNVAAVDFAAPAFYGPCPNQVENHRLLPTKEADFDGSAASCAAKCLALDDCSLFSLLLQEHPHRPAVMTTLLGPIERSHAFRYQRDGAECCKLEPGDAGWQTNAPTGLAPFSLHAFPSRTTPVCPAFRAGGCHDKTSLKISETNTNRETAATCDTTCRSLTDCVAFIHEETMQQDNKNCEFFRTGCTSMSLTSDGAWKTQQVFTLARNEAECLDTREVPRIAHCPKKHNGHCSVDSSVSSNNVDKQAIQRYRDRAYTKDECRYLCSVSSYEGASYTVNTRCTYFYVGKPDGSYPGFCDLFRGTCTEASSGAADWEGFSMSECTVRGLQLATTPPDHVGEESWVGHRLYRYPDTRLQFRVNGSPPLLVSELDLQNTPNCEGPVGDHHYYFQCSGYLPFDADAAGSVGSP